jgi:hypothetical protein
MKFLMKASLFGLLLPTLLDAQEVGLLRLNPERPAKETKVALWGGVEEGWFRPTYEGTLQWSAGARAEGVRHGEKTTWMGSVSLGHKMGYGMLSSMLQEPGYFPIDLLEFTPGTKFRETGRLEAGFVSDLGYEYAAGLKATFQAGYQGKQTDLRHSSFGMDVRVEPTLTYIMDDNMGLAMAYIFHLKTERVQLRPGDGESAFVDEGLRYGYVFDGGAFPVREMSHGFAGHFYSEEASAGLEWTWKRGKADAPGLGSYTYPGSTVSVFYEQVFLADAADHVIRASYRRDRDQLREKAADGIVATAVSDRLARDAELKYEVRFLHGAVRRLGLTLDGHRRVDRYLSPISDLVKRNLGSAALNASFSFGAFDLDLEALAGGGLWRDRGRSRDETTDMPYRRTEDWLRLMDYQMAPRVGAGGALTYRFSSPKGLYVRLDGSWLHALRKTSVGGQNREIGNLTVGYDF